MSAIARLHEWPRYCTAQARDIVLNIVRSNSPLSSRDIFNLANKDVVPQPLPQTPANANVKQLSKLRGHPPPQPTHPIRSIRYLKKVVLPALARGKEVEKFHTKVATKPGQTTDVWLWRVKQLKEPTQSRVVPTNSSSESPLAGIVDLSPAAVGVGEDWSHLNKRRQRAREKKVARDLKWMTTLQAAKREAAQRVSAEAEASPVPFAP